MPSNSEKLEKLLAAASPYPLIPNANPVGERIYDALTNLGQAPGWVLSPPCHCIMGKGIAASNAFFTWRTLEDFSLQAIVVSYQQGQRGCVVRVMAVATEEDTAGMEMKLSDEEELENLLRG